MTTKTYSIEHWCIVRKKWVVMMSWWGLQRSRAEGAFMVLKAGYGGSQKYRLVDSEGNIIEEHNTGEIKLN
jgi:hypothetical protein